MKRLVIAVVGIVFIGAVAVCSVDSSALSGPAGTQTPAPGGNISFAAGTTISNSANPQFLSNLLGNPQLWTVVRVSAASWTCTSTTDGTVVTIRQQQTSRGTDGIPPSVDDRTATIALFDQIYPDARNLERMLSKQEFTYGALDSGRSVDTLAAFGGSESTGFYVTYARVFNRVGFAVILDILATSEANRETDSSFAISNTAITLK